MSNLFGNSENHFFGVTAQIKTFSLGMMMNTSMHNQSMMSPGVGLDNVNTSSVLIQNATLPTPPLTNSNLTGLNDTGMIIKH